MIRGTRVFLLLTLAALSLALSGQSATAQDEAADEDTSAAAADEQDAEDSDDSVDEDDAFIRDGVFTPSERIEADSEISFPADI